MKRVSFFVILLAVCFFIPSCSDSNAETVGLYFLDVGQGDAILLRTPDGDILIDAGPEDAQERLCLRLEQLGVTELVLAVFTHPDEDHIGGADGVLSRFPTKEVWVNGAPMTNESAQRLLAVAAETDTVLFAVHAGEMRKYGDVVINVLAPLQDVSEAGNEGSIILKLHYGEVDAILTGDAGIEQEEVLVTAYGASQLSCDIYKVGHHGSNTSNSDLLLQTMKPTYAVISCGAGNSYGHPFGEVLARLDACGTAVLRTDLLGEIVFETDGKTLTYVKSK